MRTDALKSIYWITIVRFVIAAHGFLRRAAAVALLAMPGIPGHASAQCLQWKQDMISGGQIGATSGWLSNAQEACTAVTLLCATHPSGCGFNSASYGFRNWNGFQCLIHYPVKGVQYPDWTDSTSYQATRDDGQVISFLANGSSADAPAGIGMKFQVTGSGYILTDRADTLESYDVSGKLLSITSRGGVVETMGYDSSGRLSTVTNSFGRSIILTYDSRGRLSTATRQ